MGVTEVDIFVVDLVVVVAGELTMRSVVIDEDTVDRVVDFNDVVADEGTIVLISDRLAENVFAVVCTGKKDIDEILLV